jgi:hypothetical protein
VQVSDQRTDAIGRLLFRLADLVELCCDVLDLTLVEELARHVHLDRESEEHLREIVMEVPGDLDPLVGTLLRHRVGESAQNMLSLL